MAPSKKTQIPASSKCMTGMHQEELFLVLPHHGSRLKSLSGKEEFKHSMRNRGSSLGIFLRRQVFFRPKLGPFGKKCMPNIWPINNPRCLRMYDQRPFCTLGTQSSVCARGCQTSVLDDETNYRLPLSPISDWVAGWLCAKLEKCFNTGTGELFGFGAKNKI